MSLRSICIEDRLKRCWPMKTRSRTQTGGSLIPRRGRNFARSWRTGCGTCAWNWASRCRQLPCAEPISRQISRFSRSRRFRLLTWKRLRQGITSLKKKGQSSMGRPNGHAPRTPKALPEPISSRSRMAPYVARLGVPYMRKNVGKKPMARCGSSMPRASAIAARVRCASAVKNREPPASRDASVPSFGRSLLLRIRRKLRLCGKRSLPLHQAAQSSGEIGNGVRFGGAF